MIQFGALARGGDVYLLDMGGPVNITDFAHQMIPLSGLTPRLINPGGVLAKRLENGENAIRLTGLRPGEKLFEKLLIDGTGTQTRHPCIVGSKESFLGVDELMQTLSHLKMASGKQDEQEIKEILLNLPTDYQPTNQSPRLHTMLAAAS